MSERYLSDHKPSMRESFGHAFDGIGWIFVHERNFQIHVIATIMVLLLGLWLDLSRSEWLVLLVFLVLVPTLELVNTAGEIVCNIVRDELHLDYAATKIPRDLLAGAVLYSTLGALVAGAVILGPKLWQLVW